MAVISCKINLGLKDQRISIHSKKYSDKDTTESYEMPLEDIPSFIAKTKDVEKVYLSGPASYLKQIQNRTREEEIKLYKKAKTLFIFI